MLPGFLKVLTTVLVRLLALKTPYLGRYHEPSVQRHVRKISTTTISADSQINKPLSPNNTWYLALLKLIQFPHLYNSQMRDKYTWSPATCCGGTRRNLYMCGLRAGMQQNANGFSNGTTSMRLQLVWWP